MPGKRMVIKLTQNEQRLLETFVRQGHKPARAINRARILLLSNDGMKTKDIAKVLGVSTATVSNVRKKYQQKEPQHILDFLQDDPRSGRPSKCDSKVEANVTMIACAEPPAGFARWTLHLIADKLVKLDVVDRISHESVRSLLKKQAETLVK